jgi:hypothetical protein
VQKKWDGCYILRHGHDPIHPKIRGNKWQTFLKLSLSLVSSLLLSSAATKKKKQFLPPQKLYPPLLTLLLQFLPLLTPLLFLPLLTPLLFLPALSNLNLSEKSPLGSPRGLFLCAPKFAGYT